MKTLRFEQVEPAFHKWAGIFSHIYNRFDYWELINAAWASDRGVRRFPQSKIKFASYRIRCDMIDYMRDELSSRRRKQRETKGIKYKHLPYEFNFTHITRFIYNEVDKKEVIDNLIGVEKVKADNEKLNQKDFIDFIINSTYMTRTEKLFIKLYFVENFTLKEIGKVCDYTESRMSQIKISLLERLRAVDCLKSYWKGYKL